jgi:hypothetical protein
VYLLASQHRAIVQAGYLYDKHLHKEPVNSAVQRRAKDCTAEGNIFLFSTASRPAQEPTQSAIHWILGVLFPEDKAPGA